MQIRYFAWLRRKVGTGAEDVTLPAEVATVGDLLTWLANRGEPFASALARPEAIRAAVNHDFARRDTPVTSGDEVALFPPVTGG